MIQLPGETAIPRCAAAQCGALVPFAKVVAEAWLREGLIEGTIAAAAGY